MREAQVVEERKKLAAEAIKAEEEAEARRLAEAQVAEKALAEAIESECADDSGGWGWGDNDRNGDEFAGGDGTGAGDDGAAAVAIAKPTSAADAAADAMVEGLDDVFRRAAEVDIAGLEAAGSAAVQVRCHANRFTCRGIVVC